MQEHPPTPERRLETIAQLSEAGVPVAVLAAPVIPAVNDAEIETILGYVDEPELIHRDNLVLL